MGIYIHALKIKTDLAYPQPSHVVGSWFFNEGTGTTATDLAAHHNLAVAANAWIASTGNHTTCIKSAATSADIFSEIDGEAKATFSFWINTDIVDADDTFLITGGSPGGMEISTYDTALFGANKVFFLWRGTNNGACVNAASVLTAGAWVHIAFVFDGTGTANGDRLKLYINGLEVTLTYVGTIPTTITSSAGGLNIISPYARTARYLDDFAVWDTALTAAEVAVVAVSPLENTGIGLYYNAGVFEMRLIEAAPQNATTLTWLAGKIMADGFTPISETADFRTGGNIAQIGGCSVSIDNSSKLFDTLQDAGISLQGCVAEIYEFTDTGSDPSGTRIFYGKVQEIEWNENDYKLTLANGYIARKSNLATVIDKNNSDFANADTNEINNIVPIIYGNHDKSVAIRTNNIETAFKNNEATTLFDTVVPIITDTFPVIGYAYGGGDGISLVVNVKIADSFNNLSAIGSYITYFTGKYLKVVDGGENVGVYRKITSVDAFAPASGTIQFKIASYFPKVTSGSGLITSGDTQSYVKIVTVDITYRTDVWPGYGFFDENGIIVTSNLYGYIYSDTIKNFMRIPHGAISIISGDTNNNKLILTDLNLNDDLNSLIGITYQPMNYIRYETTDAAFIKWKATYKLHATHAGLAYPDNGVNVLFINNYSELPLGVADETGKYNYIQINSTAYHAQAYIQADNWNGSTKTDTINYYYYIILKKPEIPANTVFSKVYLLVKILTQPTTTGTIVTKSAEHGVGFRKYLSSSMVGANTNSSATNGVVNFIVESLPDGYNNFSTSSVYNKNYFEQAATDILWAGYQSFELNNITTVDKYNSISEFIFWMGRNLDNNDVNSYFSISDYIYIYDIILCFYSSIDIYEKFYINLNGRIYNDTWGSRKTAANLIENPPDVIEHICRLQNWSEVESMPTNGWGKAYATAPLINTTTFDSADVDFVKGLKCARQITEHNDAYSDELIRSLCREFFLGQYIDRDGKECVAYLPYKNTAGLTTITLGDIVGEVGDMIEPRPEDIFCEPFVRYKWNEGTQKYDECLKITNSSASTYASTYVTGFKTTGADERQAVWNKCHALWHLCHQVEQPGEDLTDLKWIRTEYEARVYLETWVNWMQNRRCTFSVPYVTGRTWYISKRIGIQLPHQTVNDIIEVIIEEIERDKNSGLVNVQVIFLDRLPSVEYRVQDTYKDGTLDEWINSYKTKAEQPTNAEDVQDSH